MFIVPMPQSAQIKESKFKIGETALKSDNSALSFLDCFNNNGSYTIEFKKCESDKIEYHKISITKDLCKVEYSSNQAAYRAMTTLNQIFDQKENGEIPEIEIEDFASIKNRGYMLDISRGKCPTLDYLKKLVDRMALVKFNELQLYVDSFVIDYKNFPDYVKDTEPLKLDELVELYNYAKERFVTLVPNQNSLGHMAHWTAKEEIAPLAITGKDGKPSQTLNPLKKETLEFIDKIYDGYFDLFPGEFANVGMDETVDLGLNETKEVCDREGVGKVYTDYLNKICELVIKKYKKTPMFWDDIVFKHPEQLDNIPKEAVVMEWGYETEHPYERHLKTLKEKGMRFYVCPGDSTWCSLTGRSNNALVNIWKAAESGAYHGAEGFLVTDWGDGGHPQFPAVTYIPFIFAASCSWNCMSHDHEISYDQRKSALESAKKYAAKYLFKTDSYEFSDIVYRMGNYYLLESDLAFNCVMLYHRSTKPETITPREKLVYKCIYRYMEDLRRQLVAIDADEIAKRQVLINCDMVMLFSKIVSDGKTDETDKEIDRISQEYQYLWPIDNHLHGMDMFIDLIQKKKSK